MISTETMYTKLGHICAAPGCKNCIIRGEGTSFIPVFPKFLNVV